MKRFAALLSVSVLLCGVLALGPARAGDDDAPDAQAGALQTRLYTVASLTTGRTDCLRTLLAPEGRPSRSSDEEHPQFGGEGEEPILPLGTVDELIELLKNGADPSYWEETEGADVRSLGESTLVVRADGAVQRQVAATLRELQDLVCHVVAIEVQAVHLPRTLELSPRREGDGGVLPDDAAQALIEAPDAGPGASLLAYEGTRAAFFAGRERARLTGYDALVAEKAAVRQPIVEVVDHGVSFTVRAERLAGGDRVRVDIDLAVSQPLETVRTPTGGGSVVDMPHDQVARARSQVVVPARRWVLLDGIEEEDPPAGWSFLLRAVPFAPPEEGDGEGLRLPDMPAASASQAGTYVFETHRLADLGESVTDVRGHPTHLTPSWWTEPEPPELPEPRSLLPEDAFVELLRDLSPRLWEDPAAVEVRNRLLFVRHTPAVQGAVEDLLARLREGFSRTTEADVQVVETHAIPGDGLSAATPLDADAAGRLVAELGSNAARRLALARVTSLGGARNAVDAGRTVDYVQGYEGEIAQAASLLTPVRASFFEGLEADVRPSASPDGTTAHLALRAMRTRLVTIRKVEQVPGTDGGTLELPEIEVFQVRTDFHVRWGQPVIAGSWSEGGRRQLLVVTPFRR